MSPEQVARQEWGRQFKQALGTQDLKSLLDLTAQAERTPSLSAVSGFGNQDRTPLGWAIYQRSAWGTEQLLLSNRFSAQGGVGHAELESFFGALELFNEDRHKQEAQEMLTEVWPLLRPVVGTFVAGRLEALGGFLRHFPGRAETARGHWEALGMQALCEGIVDSPFHPVGSEFSLTALQLAWINGLPIAVELLLDAGASATSPHPTTALPDWDLATATAERDRVCDVGWSPVKIQTHAQQRWRSSSPTIFEGLGNALMTVCDYRSLWQGVDQRVRAQQLNQALPPVPPKARGPRF